MHVRVGFVGHENYMHVYMFGLNKMNTCIYMGPDFSGLTMTQLM